MDSPTHRMWLLYPTLAVAGFGYKVNAVGNNWVTSSAMDVLSGIDFSADIMYPNWPARFPSPGQIGVPAKTLCHHDLVALYRSGTGSQPDHHHADNLGRCGCALHHQQRSGCLRRA